MQLVVVNKDACQQLAYPLCLFAQGLLTSWGANDSGQLGTGVTSDKLQHTPKLLRGSSSSKDKASGQAGSSSTNSSPVASGSGSTLRNYFVRCAAGAAFSVAVNSSGRCFTWGQVRGPLSHGVQCSTSLKTLKSRAVLLHERPSRPVCMHRHPLPGYTL